MLKKAAIILISFAIVVPSWSAIHFKRFDKNHSTIGFRVTIMGGMSEVEGKFTDFEVDLVYDEEDVTKSTVVVVIKTESANTGIDERDQDLRTSRFFDAKNHPEIRFESKRIEKSGDQLIAHGILTMRGIANPVSLPFEIKGLSKRDGKALIGIWASTTINRQDYDINWKHSSVPAFVGDEVKIEIKLISKLNPLDAADE